jgi:hypothetical protein
MCHLSFVLVSMDEIPNQAIYWEGRKWPTIPDCPTPIIGKPISNDSFLADFGVEAVPTHILLDSSGRTQRVWRGAVPTHEATEEFLSGVQHLSPGGLQAGGTG